MNKTELAEKIAALREKQEWHKELLAQLDEEQKQISVTDPDSRKMPTAQGMIVGYNAQVAVDARHKLIAADGRDQRGDGLQTTGQRGAGRPRATWNSNRPKWWPTRVITTRRK